MRKTQVFFRNDDVNRMEAGLVEMTDLLNRLGACVSHAVEPANLVPEVRDWLLERHGKGVEIIQHGFAHTRHDRGEFGGARPADEQRRDLAQGQVIMREAFSEAFYPAMSFPYGSYNDHTMPILNGLGYTVVSCHWRHQRSRQLFYGVGRLLGRGRLLDRHVSHHLRAYPGTNLREISVCISPIRRYHPGQGPTACEFFGPDELRAQFHRCRALSPVVGVVLHHRFHGEPAHLALLADFAAWIKEQPGIEFADLAEIATGLAARQA